MNSIEILVIERQKAWSDNVGIVAAGFGTPWQPRHTSIVTLLRIHWRSRSGSSWGEFPRGFNLSGAF